MYDLHGYTQKQIRDRGRTAMAIQRPEMVEPLKKSGKGKLIERKVCMALLN